jgi:hypothetical protein
MRQDYRYEGFLRAENNVFDNDEFIIDTTEFFSRKCKGSKEKQVQ